MGDPSSFYFILSHFTILFCFVKLNKKQHTMEAYVHPPFCKMKTKVVAQEAMNKSGPNTKSEAMAGAMRSDHLTGQNP